MHRDGLSSQPPTAAADVLYVTLGYPNGRGGEPAALDEWRWSSEIRDVFFGEGMYRNLQWMARQSLDIYNPC